MNQEKTGNENETDIGLIFHESCLWNEGSLELTFIMKKIHQDEIFLVKIGKPVVSPLKT